MFCSSIKFTDSFIFLSNIVNVHHFTVLYCLIKLQYHVHNVNHICSFTIVHLYKCISPSLYIKRIFYKVIRPTIFHFSVFSILPIVSFFWKFVSISKNDKTAKKYKMKQVKFCESFHRNFIKPNKINKFIQKIYLHGIMGNINLYCAKFFDKKLLVIEIELVLIS